MDRIAQTNIQLYNQLRGQARSEAELRLVHKAYEVCVAVYAGRFQADGKPFIAHCVGVASAVALLGRPADVVAAALVHNAYGNGDFGDGRLNEVTGSRRRYMREALGERIESMLLRFRSFRVRPETIASLNARLDGLTEVERDLILIDLADKLDKYTDLGVRYFTVNEWATGEIVQCGDEFIALAKRLGYPALAEQMAADFKAAAEADVPGFMHPDDGRIVSEIVAPLSTLTKPWLYPFIWRELLRRKLRLRSRLRKAKAALLALVGQAPRHRSVGG